jgi:hypothetical protein
MQVVTWPMELGIYVPKRIDPDVTVLRRTVCILRRMKVGLGIEAVEWYLLKAKKARSIFPSVKTHLFAPLLYMIVKGIQGRVK